MKPLPYIHIHLVNLPCSHSGHWI